MTNINLARVKLLSLFLALLLSSSSLALVPVSSSSNNTTGFDVINVSWGTPSNATSAAPGDRNVPLTITLEYVFPNTATSVHGLLQLPQGMSLYNGSNTDFASISQTTPTSTLFQLTFNSIYLSSSLALGSYSATLELSWAAAGYAYVLNQTSSITLYVQGRPEISFSSPTSSLVPGGVNNVSLSVINAGSGSASNISISVASQAAGVLDSIPQIETLPAKASDTLALELYVPKSVSGTVISLGISANYKDPQGNSKSVSQTLEFYGSNLDEPSLVFSVTPHDLSPGRVNNITVTLTNTGSGTASSITTAVSSSQATSSVSDFPRISSLSPGASYSAAVQVYISNSAADSPLTLMFTASYLDSYGALGSASQSEGFQVASGSTGTFPLSITTLSNSVTSGSVSKVSFLLKNTGDSAIHSPTLTITATQPLVVAGNSTFSSGTSIPPGESQIFTTYLTASPGSTNGVYPATIQVSFTDQYGTTHEQSYSVAVMLSGSVELVIQNEAVTQNASGITVTGSILNEGSASAYYAVVSGSLNVSKSTGSPDYVGEIDPNSPVPFTATIPFRAQSNSVLGNIDISIQYKNSLGQPANSSSSETTKLKPISQILSVNPTTIQSPNQNGMLGLSFLQLVTLFTVLIVVAGVGTVAVVRRRHDRRRIAGTAKDAGQVA